MRPPGNWGSASNTIGFNPRSAKCKAAVNPANPPPMMITLFSFIAFGIYPEILVSVFDFFAIIFTQRINSR
jgi:hypothetical protein